MVGASAITARVPCVLGVEGAQRVLLDALADVLGELVPMLAQVGHELLAVGGPRLRRAQAAEPQPQGGDLEAAQQLIEQHDQLGVDQRRVGADRLGAELVELAKAARLGPLVPEVGAQVPELHRLRQLLHAVLEIGAGDRGRSLGAQGDAAAAEIVEAEHLLADDVGRLPDPAREQLGVLEDRRLYPCVAGALEQLPRGSIDSLASDGSPGRMSKVPFGAWKRFAISARA